MKRLVIRGTVRERLGGHLTDHVHERGCRHKCCGNVAHLEPVTSKVNTHRGLALRFPQYQPGYMERVAAARAAAIASLPDEPPGQ